jgi:hypothetical protein
MAIKGGAKVSDLVRVAGTTRAGISSNVGLVIDESLDKKTGRRILLVKWSFKNTKQKKSDMVEFWIYEEELEIVSHGAK